MIIDTGIFTSKLEEREEKQTISNFVQSSIDNAVEMTKEDDDNIFFNPKAADEFCSVITQLGVTFCVPLANKWWIGYSVSEELPDDSVDAYKECSTNESLNAFVSMLLSSSIDAKGYNAVQNATAAEELCNKVIYEFNNKFCIPVANGWYLIYSAYEDPPEDGVNFLDPYPYEEVQNING